MTFPLHTLQDILISAIDLGWFVITEKMEGRIFKSCMVDFDNNLISYFGKYFDRVRIKMYLFNVLESPADQCQVIGDLS